MSRHGGRAIRLCDLLPLIALLLLAAVLLTWTQDRSALPWSDAQHLAAERMASAFPVLVEAAARRGISIDPRFDPNKTGLVGEEFTDLTTTIGTLEAKRTSTNPAFAALIVDWLGDAGLGPGDSVLIALSGSFPALALAAIVACEVLDLQPAILSSVGASSYGANRVAFAWPDIEAELFNAGVIHHRSMLATLGGEGDLGLSYFGEGRQLALEAIHRNGLPVLIEETPQAQEAKRRSFVEAVNADLLINIGGNQFNIGSDGHLLPPGLLASSSYDAERLGLIGWSLDHDVPVIHLLRIRELAIAYGLPVDPIPLPQGGDSHSSLTGPGKLLPLASLLPPILYAAWLAIRRITG